MTATVAVRERPLLMSGAMVRAVLAGSKSQTRRVVKLPPWIAKRGGLLDEAWADPGIGGGAYLKVPLHDDDTAHRVRCPHGEIGDRLWIREGLYLPDTGTSWRYVADDSLIEIDEDDPRVPAMVSWAYHKRTESCPSIHMPRWASRISLEITNVRVECLQAITWADAKAEGIGLLDDENREQWASVAPPGETNWGTYQEIFQNLWDSLNAKRGYGWDANPFVWVLEFRRTDAR